MEKPFPAVLRRWRDNRGVSQKALARLVGLSASMIALLEVGDRRPTREQILRIAAALSLGSKDTDELLLSGGQLPSVYDRTSPSDPDLMLFADVLGDPAIPREEKRRV